MLLSPFSHRQQQHENDLIYIHDPFFPTAPIEMSLIAFEIGWQEKDRQYATIGLAPPDD